MSATHSWTRWCGLVADAAEDMKVNTLLILPLSKLTRLPVIFDSFRVNWFDPWSTDDVLSVLQRVHASQLRLQICDWTVFPFTLFRGATFYDLPTGILPASLISKYGSSPGFLTCLRQPQLMMSSAASLLYPSNLRVSSHVFLWQISPWDRLVGHSSCLSPF